MQWIGYGIYPPERNLLSILCSFYIGIFFTYINIVSEKVLILYILIDIIEMVTLCWIKVSYSLLNHITFFVVPHFKDLTSLTSLQKVNIFIIKVKQAIFLNYIDYNFIE